MRWAMRKRKPREVEIKISLENHKKLQKVAKRAGLKWERVVDMILSCEVSILNYALSVRAKVAKKLKIKPTENFLYHKGLFR